LAKCTTSSGFRSNSNCRKSASSVRSSGCRRRYEAWSALRSSWITHGGCYVLYVLSLPCGWSSVKCEIDILSFFSVTFLSWNLEHISMSSSQTRGLFTNDGLAFSTSNTRTHRCVEVESEVNGKWIVFIQRFYPKCFAVASHSPTDGGANHAR